ncbi:MAG TPA: SCO family protein [Pyrinomonadaceae bacterium]|nr:SCO family protein [Pyrinomonadaceae bacterium]
MKPIDFKLDLEPGREREPSILLPLGLVILLCAVGVACRAPRQTEETTPGRRYELKGKVVAVDKEKHQVTLDHEDIDGYMEGMVMPFTLKDETILRDLAPGDVVQATLVVTEGSAWLEDVKYSRAIPVNANKVLTEARPEPGPGDAVPAFSLVNQDAKAIRLDKYRGKALLLTFIYTRCPVPEYCTLMSTNFAAVDKELQKTPGLFEKTHLLSVSFDPGYDTPEVLRSYGAAHTGNYTAETFKHWEFATGTPAEIKEIAQFFGLTYQQETDQIVHSLRTAIITPEGRIYKIYRGNDWQPDEVLRDLRILLGKG